MNRYAIGIRREDLNRWERRTPLTPTEVRSLIKDEGIDVYVQPSTIRVYADEAFAAAGAAVAEDLCPTQTVFAIKEIPLTAIRPRKTYVCFAHVIKGQPANMPMLKRMMELGCSLIDYEKVEDERGKRLIFFGHYAGLAGMIDTLGALGLRLADEGTESPFDGLKPAWQYPHLAAAREAMARAGERVRAEGVGPGLTPFVVGITGYGNVSKGAQEMLELLRPEEIAPSDLEKVSARGRHNDRKIYKVIFKEEHMVEPKTPGHAFQLQDYYDFPAKYHPVLNRYLPYLSVLVNCIYWDVQYPVFISKPDLAELFGGVRSPRLRVIGDISCDVNGGCQATLKATHPDNPIYVYDVDRDAAVDGVAGKGPVIMAVYNLPAELPADASSYFGRMLLPYVPAIATVDWEQSWADAALPPPIKRATILAGGELTPPFAYLERYLK